MDNYRATNRNGILFYTNKGEYKSVKDNLMKLCPPDKFMISYSRTYYSKEDKVNKKCSEYALITEKELNGLLREDNRLFEIMHSDRPMKVSFDIDFKCSADRAHHDVLPSIKEKILQYLPNARLNISGGAYVLGNQKKVSYHVIVENYYAEDLSGLISIKALTMEYAHLGFDPAIYKKDGQMKFINQSKGDGRIQAFIAGSKNLMDHTVLHNIPEDAINIKTLDLWFPTMPKINKRKENVNKKTSIDVLKEIKPRNLPVPKDFDLESADHLTKLNMLPNEERGSEYALSGHVHWNIRRWCKGIGLHIDDYWKWAQQKDASLDRYQRHLKCWNSINLERYPVKANTLNVLLLLTYDNILKTAAARRMISKFNTRFDHLIESPWLSAKDLYQERKHIVLHTQLGSNKSGSTIDFAAEFAQKFPEKRILFVTCRVALTNDQRKRIADSGIPFKIYLDMSKKEKENPPHIKYFMCSIQSLYLARGHYNLIVIDESETVFASFAEDAKCHRNIHMNWIPLLTLVKKAEKVIWMDGLLTDTTLNFISRIEESQDNAFIIGRKEPQSRRSIKFCSSMEALHAQIFDALDAGKKIFIGATRKGRNTEQAGSVEFVLSTLMIKYNWKRNKEIIAYHGDATTEKKELQHIDEIWGNAKVRCIIGNACLAVGVNFSQKNVFDKIFMLYEPSIMNQRDFFQLLYRIRFPKDTCMVVYKSRNSDLGARVDERGLIKPTDEVWKGLQHDMKIEQVTNRTSSTKDSIFKHYCKMLNIRIEKDKFALTNEESEIITDMYDKSEVCFSWKNIPSITEVEAERITELVELEDATMVERLSLQKYRFCRIFKDDTSSNLKGVFWDTDFTMAWACWKLGYHEQFVKNPKMCKLSWGKEHAATEIIHKLFLTNAIQLGDTFPANIECTTDLKDIKEAFRFAREPKTYRNDLFSKILAAYFGRDIFFKNYESTSNGKRYKYCTLEHYVKSSRTLVKILKVWCIAPEEWKLSDFLDL